MYKAFKNKRGLIFNEWKNNQLYLLSMDRFKLLII